MDGGSSVTNTSCTTVRNRTENGGRNDMLFARETYVNATKGCMYGDSGVFETHTDDVGKLFKSFQRVYGRCISSIYRDTPDGGRTRHGWVFQGKAEYDDWPRFRHGDRHYLREVWVELHTAKPTVVTTEHLLVMEDK